MAIKPLVAEFKQSQTRTGYLVVFNVLLLGLGNLFWVAAMRVVGKRPVYLFALLIFVASNVWSYEAKAFNSLLAARIVSGFAASAADATVPALVADLFFVHERGACMMIFHLALSCGFFLGPLISAYITEYAGWRWSCGFLAIAGGVTFLLALFTIREPNYPRHLADIEKPASAYPPKRSFGSWMGLTVGYDRHASFFGSLFRMISMVAYPPVTWVGFTVGTFVGWYRQNPLVDFYNLLTCTRNIVVQLTSSRTFTARPYNWKLGSLGLLSISGFIGALIAFFLGGKLIDIISSRLTKRMGGRREPEFRLPAIIFPAIIGPAGILIFGLCIAHKTAWIGPAVGYCMQGFGLTAVANVAVTYAVDGYEPVRISFDSEMRVPTDRFTACWRSPRGHLCYS